MNKKEFGEEKKRKEGGGGGGIFWDMQTGAIASCRPHLRIFSERGENRQNFPRPSVPIRLAVVAVSPPAYLLLLVFLFFPHLVHLTLVTSNRGPPPSSSFLRVFPLLSKLLPSLTLSKTKEREGREAFTTTLTRLRVTFPPSLEEGGEFSWGEEEVGDILVFVQVKSGLRQRRRGEEGCVSLSLQEEEKRRV